MLGAAAAAPPWGRVILARRLSPGTTVAMSARGPSVCSHAYVVLTPGSPVAPGSPRDVRWEGAFGLGRGSSMGQVQPRLTRPTSARHRACDAPPGPLGDVSLWCHHRTDLLSWCAVPRMSPHLRHGLGTVDYTADTLAVPPAQGDPSPRSEMSLHLASAVHRLL